MRTLSPERAAKLLDRIPMPAGDVCWEWAGAKVGGGYGGFNYDDYSTVVAHRAAYEYLVGPIPAGLTLDHLCRNRICVRPDHLEPVTIGENVLRGNNRAAVNARKTHCIRGHEFTPENTYLQRSGDKVRGRGCRTCFRAYQKEWRAARRAKLVEVGQDV